MKTPRLCLLLTVAALAAAPSAFAQLRPSPRLLTPLRTVITRAPLNVTTTVVQPVANPITVTIDNSFDRDSGTGVFAIEATLPNGRTTSVEGTITVTPIIGISIEGTVITAGGQSIDYTNTAVRSDSGITVTSSITPPSGDTQTHITVIPLPEEEDESDGFLARLMKRLRAPRG